jgi:hypothetical protein
MAMRSTRLRRSYIGLITAVYIQAVVYTSSHNLHNADVAAANYA